MARHPKLIHFSLLRVVKRFMVLDGVIQPRIGAKGVETTTPYKWLFKSMLLTLKTPNKTWDREEASR